MSPTLSDEDLRRRLFAANAVIRQSRRDRRMPFFEYVVMAGLCLFYIFFFIGLAWHLLTDLPLQ